MITFYLSREVSQKYFQKPYEIFFLMTPSYLRYKISDCKTTFQAFFVLLMTFKRIVLFIANDDGEV